MTEFIIASLMISIIILIVLHNLELRRQNEENINRRASVDQKLYGKPTNQQMQSNEGKADNQDGSPSQSNQIQASE
jgi:hypothetical protein